MRRSPFETSPDAVVLAVRVTPRANKAALAGLVDAERGGRAVAVRLPAPPVEGAANEALIRFLADELKLSRSAVRIVAGERSRTKRVRLDGISEGDVRQWLARHGLANAD